MRKNDHNSRIVYKVRWPSLFKEKRYLMIKHSSTFYSSISNKSITWGKKKLNDKTKQTTLRQEKRKRNDEDQ